MRMLLKANLPNDSANELARKGKLGSTIQAIVGEMKPEAAYFTEDEGQRTAYVFFDMKDSSELPGIAEPWFLGLNARITVRPAMSPEDLGKAAAGIEAAVKKFGGN